MHIWIASNGMVFIMFFFPVKKLFLHDESLNKFYQLFAQSLHFECFL